MFDTMLNIMSVTTQAPSPEELDAGADPEVIVSLVPGLVLPLADPGDPHKPIVVPLGQLRFRIDGDASKTIGAKLVEEGERLPARSRVEVATSMAGAEETARRLEELRG